MERFRVFDIETAALADAADYIVPPKPRANLKCPAKIAAYRRVPVFSRGPQPG